MKKLILICLLLGVVLVTITSFMGRVDECVTWSSLESSISTLYREPLFFLLILPKTLHYLLVCKLTDLFGVSASQFIIITAPLTGAILGLLLGTLLLNRKPTTKWVVVCGILGSFWGTYTGMIGMLGECRTGTIIEFYKYAILELFKNPLSVIPYLPLAISSPIVCNLLGQYGVGIVSVTILIGAIIGALLGLVYHKFIQQYIKKRSEKI